MTGISADGQTVVGGGLSRRPSFNDALVWTQDEGTRALPDYVDVLGNIRPVIGDPTGVSGDGSVVLVDRVRWTGGSSSQLWPLLPADAQINVLGDDGVTWAGVVAPLFDPGHTFVGASRGGTRIPAIPEGWLLIPTGLSADNGVLVGNVPTPPTQADLSGARRWTSADGVQPLRNFEGGTTDGLVEAVSANGSISVGKIGTDVGDAAVRWLADGTPEPLGFLEDQPTRSIDIFHGDFADLGPDSPFNQSHAYDSSADGSVVVGGSLHNDGQNAFVWTEGAGMQSLYDILAAQGDVDLDGWQLTRAIAVSDDGMTVTGWGFQNGTFRSWVVSIPEPGGVGCLVCFALFIHRRGRHALSRDVLACRDASACGH